MKRGLKRSLVRPKTSLLPSDDGQLGPEQEPMLDAAPTAFKRAASGAGSAWKAGAVAQTQGNLDDARDRLSADILSGDHVLSVDPDQISDPIGSDRRADWQNQEEFRSLVESIKTYGQDTPITLWQVVPDWQPDKLDPANIASVQFLLLAGRRRHAAAKELGIPVRAVLAAPPNVQGESATFQMLVLRFRENEEREALGAFERLLSIGEMFETLSKESSNETLTAVNFAARIGVHESVVSRARTVFRSKDQLLNAFKNAYDMSFREIQQAVATIAKAGKPEAKAPVKPRKLIVTRKVGSRKLSVASQSGNLTVSAAGLNLDRQALEGLGDVIATYLQEHGSKQ